MKIEKPADISALRDLWKQAFGDEDSFLDLFFSRGFSPERCRCISVQGKLAAAAYWLDAALEEKKLAYIYAVATDKAFRGQGLCHALMENIHGYLKENGYHGAILVPGSTALFSLYASMGYRAFGAMQEIKIAASLPAMPVRRIDKTRFSTLREKYLPHGGVMQNGAMLDMMDALYVFYETEDALFCAAKQENGAYIAEYLGNAEHLQQYVAALGVQPARVRMRGGETPFAMFLPLQADAPTPGYFAFALD